MGFKVNLFADTTLSCQGSQWHIYGIPMLERQIRVFASLGAEKITVIGPPGDEAIHKQLNQADVSWFKSVHPVAEVTSCRRWQTTQLLTESALVGSIGMDEYEINDILQSPE